MTMFWLWSCILFCLIILNTMATLAVWMATLMMVRSMLSTLRMTHISWE